MTKYDMQANVKECEQNTSQTEHTEKNDSIFSKREIERRFYNMCRFCLFIIIIIGFPIFLFASQVWGIKIICACIFFSILFGFFGLLCKITKRKQFINFDIL